MSELFGMDVPWQGWILMLTGAVAIVGVIGALFLPDWPTPDYRLGFDADPGSEDFLDLAAGFLNVPVLRGGTAELLQNGDRFYSAMLEAIRGAKDTINFEVYIFESDGISREFIEAFKERAGAGVEVRLLLDAFGSW
jgi:cardiolipin synthase